MSIDFIAPVAAIHEPALAPSVRPASIQVSPSGPASFEGMVSNGLHHVSAQLEASQVDLQRLATGDVDNLHQVMLRLEESRISFQLMLQVRNRLLESYQDVMRMQV
jgi:flagellar hook-basal body complex protein FliE